MKIKSIPITDRPRERLLEKGSSNLSNEELISIILNNGNKKNSVKEISNSLLEHIKDIRELKNMNYQELIKIKGIGNAKACILLALIELSNRMNQSINTLNNKKFNNPEIIFDYYKNKFQNEMQENFYCVYLDKKKRIIESKLLFKGTLDRSVVHPREIFKEAYTLSATSIICIHNHPSLDITPSKEDKILTQNLKEVGNILGIPIIDHIIIGDGYYSFFENGEL